MRAGPLALRGSWAAVAAALALACGGPRAELRRSGDEGVLVRVRAAGARGAALLGSMNGWRPEPMERRGDAFELAMRLPPGRYEYRIEVTDAAGSREIWPDGAERVADGFGGENGVLRVP